MGVDEVERIAHGEDPLLDVPTVAARLATTVSHVRLLIQRGELGHVRVGRFIRVAESEVVAYLRGTLGG